MQLLAYSSVWMVWKSKKADVSEAPVHPPPGMLLCSACHAVHPDEHFSSSQLKKKNCRRCASCASYTAPGSELSLPDGLGGGAHSDEAPTVTAPALEPWAFYDRIGRPQRVLAPMVDQVISSQRSMIEFEFERPGRQRRITDAVRAWQHRSKCFSPCTLQSEPAFRMLCRAYGAQLCYTPMINARHYIGSERYQREVNDVWPEGDRPLIAQLAGDDEVRGGGLVDSCPLVIPPDHHSEDLRL